MISKETTMVAAQGFHMRPASVFVKEMSKFKSKINILVGDKTVDAKSLMIILSAGIKQGAKLTIQADGEDEQAALNKAIELIDSGFGE
ncbi:MAG: HPr family phosphocarrier protein [Firmicutes bacterium]|nr:HPr family phosphocarrier protein [Bacillota bacterium]MCL1953963.1 HPr family phosphocarrier protein [Bacillota bacterium]